MLLLKRWISEAGLVPDHVPTAGAIGSDVAGISLSEQGCAIFGSKREEMMMQSAIIFLRTTALFLFVTVLIATGFSSTVSAATLINGGHISDAISIVGEEDVYTFTASAGDHVEFRMVDTSLTGDLVPRIELYGPSGGNYLTYGQSLTVAAIAYTIPESGTYTLVAKDNTSLQDSSGSYNLYYVKVPGANELGTPTNGEMLSETIDVGDLDTYTFTAVAGDHVEI
ncbi:MAG: pre-peptidase C-terminal domain-containing protein, partial [Proteobacteria bacterium]|nr:pre-peptidase C-terminal domain-containing protein [Pseudomonadota bacterium]MBU4297246.1 pre-peptidase C-terminal domain-containing protein [Pseudomonadota bacterium]MCG2747697.1 hypothetical protein [Desulfobulbaceae bacterium]